MAQWGSRDTANASVLWSGALVKSTPNSSVRDAMWSNSTANAFVSGATVGVYGIEKTELSNGAVAHTGWVLQTTGSGGRAGRVQTEVLVAGGMANSTGG